MPLSFLDTQRILNDSATLLRQAASVSEDRDQRDTLCLAANIVQSGSWTAERDMENDEVYVVPGPIPGAPGQAEGEAMTDKTFTPEQITSAYEEWVGKDLTAANLVDFVRAFGVTVVDSPPVPVGTAGTVTMRGEKLRGIKWRDGYLVVTPDGWLPAKHGDVTDFTPDRIVTHETLDELIGDLDDEDTISVGTIYRSLMGSDRP